MSTKHLLLRAPSLTLVALALGLTACQPGDDPLGVYSGRVQFTLSSGDPVLAAPDASSPSATGEWENDRHPFFKAANVTFTSILARDTDGVLVNVQMELPATVDIIAMEEVGRTVTLPDGELPPATYDQIVVVMSQVQGVLRDDTTITIDPPGGGWTAVVPLCPFEVAEDATAVVGLMLPVRSALVWREGRFRFQPRFRSRIPCEMDGPEPEEDSTDDDQVS